MTAEVVCVECNERPRFAHSRCTRCYQRAVKAGRVVPKRRISLRERVLASYAVTDEGCWQWTGSARGNGYGGIKVNRHYCLAHRIAYELFVGPIPDGLHIDHLCRNRACVNPAHLEPVQPRENVLRGVGLPAVNARKTHCKHGHEFTTENTHWSLKRGNPIRICRACRRISAAKQWRRNHPGCAA